MAESDRFLKGQYLVVPAAMNPGGLSRLRFHTARSWRGYTVYGGESLPVVEAAGERMNLLLLGFFVHPRFHDLDDAALLARIARESKSIPDVMRRLQDCAGRFVVLADCQSETAALPDACAMRQLYWHHGGKGLLLSSSARLLLDVLGMTPEVDERTAKLIANPLYRRAESPWYGETWFDRRIGKVTANRYLDLRSGRVARAPYHYDGPTSHREIVSYAASVLTGSMRAIHSRRSGSPVIQAVTAGYDSRLLLAASREFSDRTRYYIFDNGYALGGSSDIRVATGLSRALDLRFQVIMPGKLRPDFLAEYEKKCYFPRTITNTPHIQWHYDMHRDLDVLNVNGNCAEIARHFYQNRAGTSEDLRDIVKLAGFNGFFEEPVTAWYRESLDFCREHRFTLSDLFYWEQRMGNWGAMYRFEQDIAIDEFTPYNHKNLLLALLHVRLDARKAPNYPLFRELIGELWPETLALPFNPIVGLQVKTRAKKVIKLMLGKK